MFHKWFLLLPLLLPATQVLAKEGDEPASVFAGGPWQSLAALIAFTMLFFLLRRFAWGPILKGLQDRENKIRNDLDKAEKTAAQAAKTLAEYQALIAGADQEARKIIDAGRRDAETVAAQMKEQAEKEMQALKQRVRQDIHSAKEQALAEIFSRVAIASTELAGSILKKEIDADSHKELVSSSLQQLQNRENN